MDSPGRPQPIPRDARRISVPAVVLDQWLAAIADPAELKVALRAVALLAARSARGRTPPSLSLDELLDDAALNPTDGSSTDNNIRVAFAAAVDHGTLLAVRTGGDVRVMLNDAISQEYLADTGLTPLEPADIAGVAPLGTQAYQPAPDAPTPKTRGNVFALYERHIGTFGHGVAEQLKAAEEEYPASWIDDAFAIATEQNVRSWGYVHAILRRWLQEGKPAVPSATAARTRETDHDDGKPGHDTPPDRRTGYLESYRRRHGRLPWEPADDGDGDRP